MWKGPVLLQWDTEMLRRKVWVPVTSPLGYSSLLGSAAPVLGSSCGVIRILETKNFAWFCPVVSKMWQMPQSPLLFMFTYCHSLFAHPQCTCCPWCKNMEKVKKKPAKTPKTQTKPTKQNKNQKRNTGKFKGSVLYWICTALRLISVILLLSHGELCMGDNSIWRESMFIYRTSSTLIIKGRYKGINADVQRWVRRQPDLL